MQGSALQCLPVGGREGGIIHTLFAFLGWTSFLFSQQVVLGCMWIGKRWPLQFCVASRLWAAVPSWHCPCGTGRTSSQTPPPMTEASSCGRQLPRSATSPSRHRPPLSVAMGIHSGVGATPLSDMRRAWAQTLAWQMLKISKRWVEFG